MIKDKIISLCSFCNKEFVLTRSDKIYCSKQCKDKKREQRFIKINKVGRYTKRRKSDPKLKLWLDKNHLRLLRLYRKWRKENPERQKFLWERWADKHPGYYRLKKD